jgi:hypothetical protein|tara:strand:+ start:212 stop:421 length:210 start_codon:yes stop_codon:yes gene_type:complete
MEIKININDLKFLLTEAKAHMETRDEDWTANLRMIVIEQKIKDATEFDEFAESKYHSDIANCIDEFMGE